MPLVRFRRLHGALGAEPSKAGRDDSEFRQTAPAIRFSTNCQGLTPAETVTLVRGRAPASVMLPGQGESRRRQDAIARTRIDPETADTHDAGKGHGKQHLGDPEMPVNTHLFFAIYFCMTGLHGIHVVIGMWHKYPNPHCSHVITVDVLDRSVDPNTGVIRTERILGCQQKAPMWIVKVSKFATSVS